MSSQPQPVPSESAANQAQISKDRGTYKPKVIQTEVIAGALLGHSIRRISRDTGINPRTVKRIIKENEVHEVQRVAGARIDATLPEAASVLCEKITVNRDATCAIAALRGRGVLRTDGTTINLVAANSNVIMGVWPEFAGALPGAIQDEARKLPAAQTIDAEPVEPSNS